jgi:hypothetical protein
LILVWTNKFKASEFKSYPIAGFTIKTTMFNEIFEVDKCSNIGDGWVGDARSVV